MELINQGIFLVSKVDQVLLFDARTFEQCGHIPITLLPTKSREPNEILGMQKTPDESMIAIITGKNLVMNCQKQNQLIIMKIKKTTREDKTSCFQEYKRVILKDIQYFKDVSMKYFFKNKPHEFSNYDTILFAKKEEIFEFNFETEQFKIIYRYEVSLNNQP